jgi:type I restriction-modification system DNA methylase subunit
MTQQQLEKHLWGAATALRGTIDAGDYKKYIFPLLFFKRICDVYDEEFERALEERRWRYGIRCICRASSHPNRVADRGTG